MVLRKTAPHWLRGSTGAAEPVPGEPQGCPLQEAPGPRAQGPGAARRYTGRIEIGMDVAASEFYLVHA